MRKVFKLISALAILTILFTACAPKATPTITAEPSSLPDATIEASNTDTPVTASPDTPATIVSIAITPPPMEVDSTFLYIDGTTLVAVPSGEFTMGKQNGTDNTEHKVSLGDFWIYSTEVTNNQYRNCVAADQCSEPDLNDNQGYNDYKRTGEPVSGVTWEQAVEYCSFVHGRLPSEAEWEKAARGPNANIFPWGNEDPTCDLLNFKNCRAKTTTVSQYPNGKSFYSLYDMAGNVYEWVNDWYDPFYYKNSPTENPLGPDTGTDRSYRSSGYSSNADQVPSSVRFSADPTIHDRSLGFRCVVEDPLYFAPFCQTVLVTGIGSDGQPTPGGESQLSCPGLAIGLAVPLCNTASNTPYTNINIPQSTAQYVTDFGGCTLDSGSTYVCLSETDITIDTAPSCSVSQPNPASCPAGYQQNGNICEPIQGWTGQCLPGQNFDPATQCCTEASGSGSAVGLEPFCGAGFSFNPQTQTCDPFNYPPVTNIHIPLTGCNPPGNDNPGDDPDDPDNPCPPGTHPGPSTSGNFPPLCIPN